MRWMGGTRWSTGLEQQGLSRHPSYGCWRLVKPAQLRLGRQVLPSPVLQALSPKVTVLCSTKLHKLSQGSGLHLVLCPALQAFLPRCLCFAVVDAVWV